MLHRKDFQKIFSKNFKKTLALIKKARYTTNKSTRLSFATHKTF